MPDEQVMPQELVLHIDGSLDGKRLDVALGQLIDSHSRSALSELITRGRVTLDEKSVTRPSLKVSEGSVVRVLLEQKENEHDLPQDLPLDVIYEDQDILVINKGTDFVVHPGAGVRDGTVLNALLFHYPQTKTLNRAGIVHRLDKNTSGLMVIALSKVAQVRLVAAISKHKVLREYEAIVHGVVTSGGTVRGYMGRDTHNRVRMAVLPEGMGREAVTHYRVMEKFRAHSRLRLHLETGRTHQIRVHMASIDHPIVGDSTYGSRRARHLKGASPELDEALVGFGHQALHAVALELLHPVSKEKMRFEAPLPEDFERLLRLLRADFKEHGDGL